MNTDYEIIGKLKCTNDLSIDYNNNICLPIHMYIPLLMAFCYAK